MNIEAKKLVADLCRNGAFAPFLMVAEEVAKTFEEIHFTSGEQLVYNCGKRDGARAFNDALLDTIEAYAKQ
jgi:hypothetical protein